MNNYRSSVDLKSLTATVSDVLQPVTESEDGTQITDGTQAALPLYRHHLFQCHTKCFFIKP